MKKGEWLVLTATVLLAGLAVGWVLLRPAGHHAKLAVRSAPTSATTVAPATTTTTTTKAAPPTTTSAFDVINPPPTTPHPTAPTTTVATGGVGPTRLVIPRLGVDAPIVPTGASGPNGGALVIPSDIHVVGWWDGVWQSPTGTINEAVPEPGQPGVAVLAGHVDSAAAGDGALYSLRNAKQGDAITVYGQGGQQTNWTVSQPPLIVIKSALPSSLWVNSGPPKLAVVTCGGPFDAQTGHYVDNVIVWATPAS